MSRPVIIIGGGGHSKVIIDTLKRLNREILGVTVKNKNDADPLLGVPKLGDDSVVGEYGYDSINLVNGIGSIPGISIRKTLFDDFKAKGYRFATIIHPHAFIANDVLIAEGAQIMAGAVIQPAVIIGENTIINTRASVDHDCRIGRHCHVAPGVTLSGNVSIDDEVHLGTAASVVQGVSVGKGAVISAGAVIYQNVQSGSRVYGQKSRVISGNKLC